MFADIMMLHSYPTYPSYPERKWQSDNTMTTESEVEAADPNYAWSPPPANWVDQPYTLSCKDYDSYACHYNAYMEDKYRAFTW